MTPTTTKTVEYAVTLEPRYGTAEERAAKRQAFTLPGAENGQEAVAMMVVGGVLLSRARSALKYDGRRTGEPETCVPYSFRRRDGAESRIVVDLSATEKATIAAEKAAAEAAKQAEIDAMEPEATAYGALAKVRPYELYASTNSVRVEWRNRGTPLPSIEVNKGGGWGERPSWSPTEISMSSGRIKTTDDATTYGRMIQDAVAVAAWLDTEFSADTGRVPFGEGYTAMIRGLTSLAARIDTVLGFDAVARLALSQAAVQTGGGR